MREESDEDLAIGAAAGDRNAFARLLDRHYDRVYRLAFRICGQRQDAEDVAQDVCLKLAKAVRGYRGEARFSTWLHRIVYTTALDHNRTRQRTVVVEPSEIVKLAEVGGDESYCENGDAREIWSAVQSLPNQQRDALVLVYGEDMSHREAAEIMGCSEKTVSWHIHEAKKRLRVLLEAVG